MVDFFFANRFSLLGVSLPLAPARVSRSRATVAVPHTLRKNAILFAGAFTLAVHAYATAALAGEKKLEKVKQFGDWSMYCENGDDDQSGKCALVQSVLGGPGSDPRAWVKASVQTDASGAMTFKFRVDRGVRLEPGVSVRIDQKQVGVAVPFKCEEAFCEASVGVSNALQPNEFGVDLLTGNVIEFDVFFEDSKGAGGYRIPLTLSSLRDGVAELASKAHEAQLVAMSATEGLKEQWKRDQIGSLKKTTYTWDFLLDDKAKSDLALRIEPTLWTPMIASDDNVYAKPWKTTGELNLQKKYTTRCMVTETAGHNIALGADVKIGPELKLAGEYQNKIKQLVNESKNCGRTNFFVIMVGNGDVEKGIKFNSFERTAKTLKSSKCA